MTITKEARAEAQKNLDAFIAKFGPIERIYVGQDHCCRCGCRGRYYEEGQISKHNLSFVLRIMAAGAECEIDEGRPYVNLSYGDDRAVTIYFKGVA